MVNLYASINEDYCFLLLERTGGQFMIEYRLIMETIKKTLKALFPEYLIFESIILIPLLLRRD
jgi:hypothetical protein